MKAKITNLWQHTPSWVKYAIPIFIIFFLVLLAYYPGIIVSDGIVQWNEIQTKSFTDWHPAYHTLYMFLLTRIWNNPFFILLIQIMIISISIGISLEKIEKYYHTKKKYLYLAGILFAIIPLNFNHAVILLKDSLYSIFILLLSMEFLSIANEPDYINKKRNLLKIGFISLIIMLFRHNGILVVALSFLILIILYHKKISLYLLAIISTGIYFGMTSIGYNLLQIEKGNAANTYGPLSHYLAKILNEEETLFTKEEIEELSKYVEVEKLKTTFDQYNMDYSINSQNIEYIKNHKKEYIAFTLQIAWKNPLRFLEYYLKLDSYLYSPIPFKNQITYGMNIESDLYIYKDKYPDLNENSKIPILLDVLKFISKAYQYRLIGWVTLRPAIYTYLSIVMIVFLSKWQKNKKLWLILTPALFNLISLAPAIPVAMVRYVYSSMLVFYFILIAFFSEFKKRKPKSKKKSQ